MEKQAYTDTYMTKPKDYKNLKLCSFQIICNNNTPRGFVVYIP